MAKDSNYVMRLMRARCSCGTMDNYLNVGRDHGVLAGAEQQPVLNANDHTDKNLIHFGSCNSDANPERGFRKNLVSGLMGPIGLFAGDKVTGFLEDVGIMTCKCKPNTPVPWIHVNENNILEGAPALLMESVVPCRYGGEISLVPLDEYPPEEPAPQEEDVEKEKPMEDVVRDAAEAAINAAMEKVAQTGEAGAATVSQVQTALAAAAAMPPVSGNHSCVGEVPPIHDFSDVTYDSLFKMNDRIRAQNYAHNMDLEMPKSAIDANGMIIKQRALHDYKINNYGVDYAGCGAIALYNAIKTLAPSSEVTFPQVIYWMEPYGIMNNTFGAFPTGVSHCLNELGYETQYVFNQNPEKISQAAGNADAAISLYATTGNIHYVAFQVKSIDSKGNSLFQFYNEDNMEGEVSYHEFYEGLSKNRTRLAQLTILVNKKKD